MTVGVPEITPVPELIERPVGKVVDVYVTEPPPFKLIEGVTVVEVDTFWPNVYVVVL